MAGNTGERTEKPTHKRIREAREKGQVPRSRELAGSLSFVALVLALGWLGPDLLHAVQARIASGLSHLGDRPLDPAEPAAIAGLFWSDAGLLVTVVGPLALVGALVSVLGNVAQTGWVHSPKALHLNWARLNPASGFQRFAPSQASQELVKALVGVAMVTVVGTLLIRDYLPVAPSLTAMAPDAAAASVWERLQTLLWRCGLALTLYAAGDYALQRWRWYTQHKMTRQEVRDEARMSEGNPEMKARVRRIQREMNRSRMLKSVPNATVVITNPTHFAVALEYRRKEMAAPKVVAKGQDLMAARIRTIAREHGVPIVENVTLARALYKNVDIGETIPASLFGAVADILAYLVRIKQLVLS